MKESALVSAVIITYKRPWEILERAVKSALNQTYENLEVIVVNDYPDDAKSVESIRRNLCKLDEKRIKYIVHEKNMGACKARNTGIIAANGQYVALLDDDDEWLPEKTSRQIEGFINESIGMVYSPFYNVTDKLPGTLTVRGTKSGKLLQDLLWTNVIGGTSMPLIRKDVLVNVGMFDENILSSQDYDLWVRIAREYDIWCVNEPLTIRYMQDESITANFKKQKQGFDYFNEKHADLFKDNKKAFNYRCNRRVNKWNEQGHFKEAFQAYKLAVKARPFSSYNVVEPIKGFIKYVSLRKGK